VAGARTPCTTTRRLPRSGRAPAVLRQLARRRLARAGRSANPPRGTRPDKDRGTGLRDLHTDIQTDLRKPQAATIRAPTLTVIPVHEPVSEADAVLAVVPVDLQCHAYCLAPHRWVVAVSVMTCLLWLSGNADGIQMLRCSASHWSNKSSWFVSSPTSTAPPSGRIGQLRARLAPHLAVPSDQHRCLNVRGSARRAVLTCRTSSGSPPRDRPDLGSAEDSATDALKRVWATLDHELPPGPAGPPRRHRIRGDGGRRD